MLEARPVMITETMDAVLCSVTSSIYSLIIVTEMRH
jgi:hypothetical protein